MTAQGRKPIFLTNRISVAVAGGFVGATVGPHARSDGMPK